MVEAFVLKTCGAYLTLPGHGRGDGDARGEQVSIVLAWMPEDRVRIVAQGMPDLVAALGRDYGQHSVAVLEGDCLLIARVKTFPDPV